jgi:hypothetical protein
MRRAAGGLTQLPVQGIMEGGLTWRDPTAVPAADEGTPV